LGVVAAASPERVKLEKNAATAGINLNGSGD
jgi:hypothetical protein